ncbi:MAG: hypothetical protein QM719_10195 [Thermomonas sp.]
METDRQLWGNRHPILFSLVVLPLLTIVALIAKPFALLFSKPIVRSPSEVASIIEAFLSGTGGPYDWDDFVCGGSIANPELEAIRARCASLPDEFPPTSYSHYCSEAGFEVMRDLAARIRSTSWA